MTSEVPGWFSDALAAPVDRRSVTVDGLDITYRAWGKTGDPVVMLIHGGAAHSGWWDHIGPHLSEAHRVVAIDLSGHGDSGRRDVYSLEAWADEVVTVARAESSQPPVVFGHSMGGFVALTAAREYGEELRAAAAIDSPVKQMSPEAREWLDSRPNIPEFKSYPDRETVVSRFKTLPTDVANLPYINRHIAEDSVREVEGGWTWKFDPRIFLSTRMEPEALAGASCDIALIRGERGMASRDITDGIRDRLGQNIPVVVIPDAGHHIMLDQPIAMIAVLQTLLSQWRPAL